MKLNWLDLTTTDPAWNLAAEQYVFDHLPKDRMYLMLWQNDNAIIIGKNQNTAAQINESFVRRHGIKVVRRLSGGGAVYHDLGNLNFTIIADADSMEINFRLFCGPVIRALEKVGVKAELNGRNDMTIDGKKFSGNAQYMRGGRVMHHGTILFDSNPEILSGALQVDEEKIRAKGVQSVRSRVTNVRPHLPQDLTLPEFRRILLESILEETPGEPYVLTDKDLQAIEAIKVSRYDTWQWNYGRSPACTMVKRRRFEGCGTVEAYLTVEHGIIRELSFRGDFFSLEEPALLAKSLLDCPHSREALQQRLPQNVNSYFSGLTRPQLLDLLTD